MRVAFGDRRRSARFKATVLCVSMAAVLAGCGGGSDVEGGDASCALSVRYRGARYDGVSVEIAPREGARVGTAILPGCNDQGEEVAPEEDEKIPVARLPGVSPKVAVTWSGRDDIVLVRESLVRERTESLPPEVARLTDAPKCNERDAPIKLLGPWLGILGTDGNTELDLALPYKIDLQVQEASAPRYERAFLTVRVPANLGRPLTREDVKSSLWKGGTIELVAICAGGRYIARSVRSYPPN